MSASTDPPRPRAGFPDAWRPAGMLYLAFLLTGLAMGLWHDAIFPPLQVPRPAPLPILQALAVAQTLFVVLAYPLVLYVRTCSEPGRIDGRSTLAESALHVLIAGAFYVPGAFFADAVPTDAVRAGLQVIALYPLAWAAGALCAARPRVAPAAVLGLMVIALGLPMAFYIALEFFPPPAAAALRDLAPAVFAWDNAAARLGTWVPRPVWAWLLWPCLGLLVAWAVSRSRESGGFRPDPQAP